MAHRIYQHDKQQGVSQAWHGLTEVIPSISLEDNWLRKWELEPRRIMDADNGNVLPWVYLRCTDNPEIRIGQPYNPDTFQPVTNTDFLKMIGDSIGGTSHKVVSVGSVRNRGRVFLSIELIGMEQFESAGRKFGAFLNFGNGHDKSSVLWVNTSNISVVCDNTFSINLLSVENKAKSSGGEEEEVSIRQRHTKNVKLNLPKISDLVDKAIGVQKEFQVAFEQIGKVSLVNEDARNLFAGFVGRKIPSKDRRLGFSTRSLNTVNRLDELFNRGRGNKGETMADAFSAVTDYYTHESSGGNNTARQFLSSEFGSGSDTKREFWGVVYGEDWEDRVESSQAVGEELLVNTKH